MKIIFVNKSFNPRYTYFVYENKGYSVILLTAKILFHFIKIIIFICCRCNLLLMFKNNSFQLIINNLGNPFIIKNIFEIQPVFKLLWTIFFINFRSRRSSGAATAVTPQPKNFNPGGKSDVLDVLRGISILLLDLYIVRIFTTNQSYQSSY